jgi:hypothetical protein
MTTRILGKVTPQIYHVAPPNTTRRALYFSHCLVSPLVTLSYHLRVWQAVTK